MTPAFLRGSSGEAVPPAVADAYRHCEQVTKDAARNFYYGIRLLPPGKRAALCALYAFARRLDDIGDGDLPAAAKIEGMAAARTDLAAISATSPDPVLAAVADAARRYPVPVEAFGEVIDGVEMDLRGTRYDTFDELVGYCRCVAGSIGRLCLGVFGSSSPRGPELADTLGIALQQTNILRDIREDLQGGRVYVPAEDLSRFGVELALLPDGRVGGPAENLTALVRAGAGRADEWYARGRGLFALLDRRSTACCGAMSGIYLRLNHRILADPAAVLARRVSLPPWEKGLVAAGSLAGRTP